MFSFVDHTAELEVRLEAATREGVLAEAVVALHAILEPDEEGGEGEPVSRTVVVTASDDPALLAAWLDELVFLVETERFVPEVAEDVRVEGQAARGTVRGRIGAPRHLVKAVTYNDLELRAARGRWIGRVVLDV